MFVRVSLFGSSPAQLDGRLRGPSVGPVPPDYLLRSWGLEDGLPSSTVNRTLQDRNGYLWFATLGGLVRFDGLSFKEFDSPLIAGLTARNIRDLAQEDAETLVMLQAVGDVVRYRNGVFSRHPMAYHLDGKRLNSLFVEPSGAVWVSTISEDVYRWKDGKMTALEKRWGSNRGIRGVGFAADEEGQVWIAGGRRMRWRWALPTRRRGITGFAWCHNRCLRDKWRIPGNVLDTQLSLRLASRPLVSPR